MYLKIVIMTLKTTNPAKTGSKSCTKKVKYCKEKNDGFVALNRSISARCFDLKLHAPRRGGGAVAVVAVVTYKQKNRANQHVLSWKIMKIQQ